MMMLSIQQMSSSSDSNQEEVLEVEVPCTDVDSSVLST